MGLTDREAKYRQKKKKKKKEKDTFRTQTKPNAPQYNLKMLLQ